MNRGRAQALYDPCSPAKVLTKAQSPDFTLAVEPAAHDAWFRANVQEALNDTRLQCPTKTLRHTSPNAGQPGKEHDEWWRDQPFESFPGFSLSITQ